MDAKIDFIVDLGWFGTKVSKNVGVQIFGPLDPNIGTPRAESASISASTGWILMILRSFWGVFHDAESISGAVAIRSRANAVKLRESIELHCEGNPLMKKTPLNNIVSSALVQSDANDDILHFQEKGQKRLEEFIHDRLLSSSVLSIWDPMKKTQAQNLFELDGEN